MSAEPCENKDGAAHPKTPIGAPCWIEIPSIDPPKLKEFYAGLFPAWNFLPASEQYKEENICMISFEQPSGLHGGIVKIPESCRGTVEQPMGIGQTVYYWVDSLEEVEKKVHGSGGTTVMGKTREGKSGWFMNFKDPEGNRFAAYTMESESAGGAKE